MTRKYKSDALEALHETVSGLHRASLIDKQTMRSFDIACLTDVDQMSAKQVAEVRKHAGVSQAVFASYLNVTPGLVSQWERGEKQPRGSSLKLLALVKKNGLEGLMAEFSQNPTLSVSTKVPLMKHGRKSKK